MKQLKKDLKVVNKGLKALIRKTESIEKKIARLEKTSPKKKKAKVKARATKKAVAKKAKKISIPETVFGVMKRSKKGFDAAMLMKKTGLRKQQVHDALFKLKKRGMIQIVGKGVYVKR
jgi:predicted Rossmann fold nucleotide-binding protein DprA/Smf involved in DNA uptake